MEIYNYNHCFYAASNTSINCDCHKVFFQVYIDFRPKVIAFCKDFYNMRFKELMYKYYEQKGIDFYGYNDDFNKKYYSNHPSFVSMRKAIIESIIDEAVQEIFGSYFPKYKLDKSTDNNIGYVNVKVVERPSKWVKIGCISLIEFFNVNNVDTIKNASNTPILNELWEDFGKVIMAFIKKHSKYKSSVVRFKQLLCESRMIGDHNIYNRDYCQTFPAFNNEACLLLFQTFINKKKNGTN